MLKEQEEKPVKDKRFAGLDNAELVLIYHRLNKYLSGLEDNFKQNKFQKVVDPKLGKTAIVSISNEQIKELKSAPYYQTSLSIIKKLQPIVELIEGSDAIEPKLLNQLK